MEEKIQNFEFSVTYQLGLVQVLALGLDGGEDLLRLFGLHLLGGDLLKNNRKIKKMCGNLNSLCSLLCVVCTLATFLVTFLATRLATRLVVFLVALRATRFIIFLAMVGMCVSFFLIN